MEMSGPNSLECPANPQCVHVDAFNESLNLQASRVDGLRVLASNTVDLGRNRDHAEGAAARAATEVTVQSLEWDATVATCTGECALAAMAVHKYLSTME